MTVCAACHLQNEPDARFCDRCGTALTASTAAVASGPHSVAGLSAPGPLQASQRRALIVGAAASCGVVVPHPQVSGEHAVVWGTLAERWISDLGSTNGVYVDDVRIQRPTRLEEGGRVRLGTYSFDWTNAAARLPTSAPVVVVGRASEADVVVDAPTVSSLHALLLPGSDAIGVIDLNSGNGTAIGEGGQKLRRPGQAKPDDVLFLGSLRFPLESALRRHAGAPVGVRVGKAPLIVGRAAECDVVVGSPQVSGRHVKLTPQNDGSLVIDDLGSANGTFLNGARITRGIWRAGDKLSLASCPLEIDPSRGVRVSPTAGSLRVDARAVSFVVPDRQTGAPRHLLNSVSFSIYPAELVALMGPSGAGKTTLLLSLNGYVPPTSGQVLVNGQDLFANFERFRTVIGYVSQDDTLYGELTVREALAYTARLRLPPDTTDAEIHERVERVARELKLVPQLDVQIGSVEKKVLSGGQRKRVNLAQELITDPPLLFLDEPTSGLSSRDTADVMQVLRELADSGRTIIITIHQPSREVYEKIDNVIYMAPGGQLAYFGPTAPDSYAYFGTDRDPDAIMTSLDDRAVGWPTRYQSSPQRKTFVDERFAEPDRTPPAPATRQRGHGRQLPVLLGRYSKLKVRDGATAAAMMLASPAIACFFAAIFHHAQEHPLKRDQPLFFACITLIFFSCFFASREIVSERAIFKRERMVNLQIGPYLLSKFLVLGLVGMLQAAMLLAILIPTLGLDGDPLAYWGVCTLTSWTATALGLLVSALVPTPSLAMILVPILLIPQIVLGGVIVPLREEGREFVETLAAVYPSRWSMEALLDVERIGLEKRTDPTELDCQEVMTANAVAPDAALRVSEAAMWRACAIRQKDLTAERLDYDLGVLAGMCVSLLGAAGLVLRRKP